MQPDEFFLVVKEYMVLATQMPCKKLYLGINDAAPFKCMFKQMLK